jgi:hypothetical protein
VALFRQSEVVTHSRAVPVPPTRHHGPRGLISVQPVCGQNMALDQPIQPHPQLGHATPLVGQGRTAKVPPYGNGLRVGCRIKPVKAKLPLTDEPGDASGTSVILPLREQGDVQLPRYTPRLQGQARQSMPSSKEPDCAAKITTASLPRGPMNFPAFSRLAQGDMPKPSCLISVTLSALRPCKR